MRVAMAVDLAARNSTVPIRPSRSEAKLGGLVDWSACALQYRRQLGVLRVGVRKGVSPKRE